VAELAIQPFCGRKYLIGAVFVFAQEKSTFWSTFRCTVWEIMIFVGLVKEHYQSWLKSYSITRNKIPKSSEKNNQEPEIQPHTCHQTPSHPLLKKQHPTNFIHLSPKNKVNCHSFLIYKNTSNKTDQIFG
jgi:hypothetical protein